MKKSFYFALALTAGLFASCSSDEIAQAPQGGLEINDNEAAKIQLNIGKIGGATRGTGTVGDLTGEAANVWAGQKFNLFMYEKGTFKPAQYKPTETSAFEDIFNNAELTAPANAISGQATYTVLLDPTDPTSATDQYSYYPATGSYSFWAYRIDDAGTGSDGVGEPALFKADGTAATSEDEAMTVKVPFVINGSQDLMIGIADTAAAATALAGKSGVAAAAAKETPAVTAEEFAEGKIYSAYAARRNVNPTLTFQHLLTRLTFQVKAATQEVSSAAVAPVPAIAGWEAGFKVTKVVVRSKSEGNIIAAWKGDQANYDEKSERIEWTSATENWGDITTLPQLELKSRQYSVLEPADIKMEPIAGNATGVVNYTPGYVDALGNNSVDASALTAAQKAGEFVVYTTNGIDATTGLPTGSKTSLDALGTNVGYIAVHSTTVGTEHTNQGKDMSVPAYDTTTDANSNLVALVPVVPGWNGVAGTPATYKSEDASATVADETAYDALDAGVQAGKGDAAALAAATVAANENKYFFVTGDKAYKIVEDAAAVSATDNTEKTKVGEALLVAPADEHGYRVEVTYTRTKKVNSTTVQPLSDTAVVDVVRNAVVAGVKTPVPFEAGKSYNVVVTLYSDGEATSDTKLEGWENGDGLEDEYDAE